MIKMTKDNELLCPQNQKEKLKERQHPNQFGLNEQPNAIQAI
jgi:hypothetical protein